MEPNSQQTLEELIHRELSKLPERSAPETLIPRVLAKVQARRRKHWWQRPWPQWPWAAQLASAPLLLASVAGALFGVSLLWNLALGSSELNAVSTRLDSLAEVWDVLVVLGNAVAVLGRSVGQQWLLAALLIPLAMYLACVGLGTLCYRMAVYKR